MNDRVQRSRHILGLDIVRFAAAIMVMSFHYDFGKGSIPASWTGWVGVEVFFVLSGFVISYSAAESSPGRFFKSRFVRLMPSVWLCGTGTLIAVLLAGGGPNLVRRYMDTLSLWPTGPWIDGAYWTLPIEVSFYALVWLTLFRANGRWLELVLGIVSVASAAYWGARVLLQVFPLSAR